MKHRTTCRSDGACLWHNGLSINISLLTELFTVFFQKTKLLQNLKDALTYAEKDIKDGWEWYKKDSKRRKEKYRAI
ncbi:MAG: hypothetical protein F9K48_07935 [Candidatus Brocadia sp.]|nr:MAG: hypothetical protein F9K48_07935 [Candidatus Brocadia sp.]